MNYKHETELYKLKLLRPNLGNWEMDKYKRPIIKKETLDKLNLEKMVPINENNVTTKGNNSNKLVLMFSYDDVLLKYWNDPLKYGAVFKSCMAICTPDYSVGLMEYMNENESKHNVFMARWLGAVWQSLGNIVLPTISWQGPETYDYCFEGIEKGSIVVISTIGADKNYKIFIEGYNEMKKRIEPTLIIVYGDLVERMTGPIVNIKYEDAFDNSKKPEQLRLFPKYSIINRGEVI